MVKDIKGLARYDALASSFIMAAEDLEDKLIWLVGHRALKFLAVAMAISVSVALFLFLYVPIRGVSYSTLQVLWPLLSLFLLIRIYYISIDKNVKYVAHVFYIALIPWTASLSLWRIILPSYYDASLAYYVTWSGFLLGYIIMIYGLLRFKNSRQWYQIPPFDDRMIDVAGILAILGISLFVVFGLIWNGNNPADALVYLSFIVCDIAILSLCSKLLVMNIRQDVNYLIFVILGLIGINTIAGFIFEITRLYSANDIASYRIGPITDVAFNTSLMFMPLALLLYNSRMKTGALDEISNKLKETRLFAEDVIMQAPYAICVFGTNGDLFLVNDAFLNLFAVKRNEIIGHYNLFNDDNEVGVNIGPGIWKIKQGKSLVIPEMEYRSGDGKLLYLSAKVFPTFGANGRISNYVTIVEDITERLRAEQELVAAKTHAELYVDLMGHDINNIHQVALGYLELASDKLHSDGALGEDNAVLLQTPMETLKNGSRLIDNVRKLQGEKTGVYHKKVIRLDPVLEEVKNFFSYPSDGEIHINYTIEGGCSVIANDLLKDVFINVIGNSIKHSKSPLTIEVNVHSIHEGGHKLCRITIEDNGPGIPDNRKAGVFDRTSGSQGRLIGKGIGLYLVKTLVDDYCGMVWVEDRVQGDHSGGARFVILLPATED